MDVNFFELKFLIIDSFYVDVLKNDYTLQQASGICYESFLEYINSDGIESMIAISTIIRLKIRHKLQLTEYDIKNMKKVLQQAKELPLNEILNESEIEYLQEDIDIIQYQYNKLIK